MSKINDNSTGNDNAAAAHQIIASVVRRETLDLADATLLSGVEGWDSLKGVRLVLLLEEKCGRELSEAEIEGLQTVGDVARLLSNAP